MSDNILTHGTDLVSTADNPIDRTTIMEVYQFATGFQANTHKQSGKYIVRCPVKTHEDKHPSCSLNPRSDSWNCFACEGKGGKLKLIIAAEKARTMPEAAEWLKRFVGAGNDLTFKPQPSMKTHQVRGEEELIGKKRVAIHPYKDHTNRTVYEVIRNQGKPAAEGSRSKSFSQRLIGSDGKWIWTFVGQEFKRYPYLLDGVMKAAKEKKVLVVLEGEIHCDALKAIGIHTTTIAEGWKSDWEKWWNKYLNGIPLVFVVTDADDVGRRSSEKRAKAIADETRKAAVVEIFPERKNGDDILVWMIEENIIIDYRETDKITGLFNWKKMYRIPLDEARDRVIQKLSKGFRISKNVYGKNL